MLLLNVSVVMGIIMEKQVFGRNIWRTRWFITFNQQEVELKENLKKVVVQSYLDEFSIFVHEDKKFYLEVKKVF